MNVSDPGRIRRGWPTPRSPTSPSTCSARRRLALRRPYEARRDALAGLGFDGPSWQAPANHLGDGEAFFDAVRARGLEGVVAKRLGSPYRPGRRSNDWVKVQNRRRQELLIGGWMPGEGLRAKQPGSLLVGYWDATPAEAMALGRPQRLVYAGGVGTGFSEETLRVLAAALEPLARETSPFESAGTRRSSTRAVRAGAVGCVGSSPSSSARSSSCAGPTRTPCGPRRSRGCATTSRRTRSSARYRVGRGKRPRGTGHGPQDCRRRVGGADRGGGDGATARDDGRRTRRRSREVAARTRSRATSARGDDVAHRDDPATNPLRSLRATAGLVPASPSAPPRFACTGAVATPTTSSIRS